MIIAEIIIASTRSTSGLGGAFGRGSDVAPGPTCGGSRELWRTHFVISSTREPCDRLNSGFQYKLNAREWRGGKACFYTPPKVRCSDLFDDDVAACAAVGDATADEEFGEADAGLAAGAGVGLRKWYYTSDVLIKQATGWLINDLRTFGYKPMRR